MTPPRFIERSKFLTVVYYMLQGGPSAALQQKRGCRRSLAGVLLFFAAYFAVAVIIQAIFFPWGRSLDGHPTLTGRWYGDAVTADGKHLALAIDITATFWGPDEQGCMRGCDVNGTARLCGNTPSMEKYTFDGDVAGRSGRTFTLDMRHEADRAIGFVLADIHGEWSGSDTLILKGDGVVFQMHRGSEKEFRSRCLLR